MPLSPGTQIGHYEILAPLGAGSMGEVYRAHDARLNRDVAIKVLPGLSAAPDRLYRFKVEAQAAAALSHPNILAVYEMGTFEGAPYIVSELLEGITLSGALRRGPLPLRRVIDYGVQIAHGLAAAHDKGIVHRDLKPDNLFVTKDGRIKILDFGLAKIVQPKDGLIASAPTVTLAGVAVGTIGYMSPEQVRGLATDHRTDIFAFGAILYEMVMGQRSFQKPTEADTISAILNEEPLPISQLAPDTPPALQRVIGRCLEKNPEQRFQSPSDLAFALEAIAPSASGKPHQGSNVHLKRGIVWLAAVAIITIGALVAYLVLGSAPVPTVVNYVQLTHDGQQKSLIGTDGARLYLGLGDARAGSFASHGSAEMSVSGGDPRKLTILSSPGMSAVDLSPDGSELLVVDGQGAPPKGPLLAFPLLGGSPRKIGSMTAETATWSPDGKMLAYTNLGDIFLSRSDGAESHKLISVNGDISNVTWSPDGSTLRFDSSETTGTSGSQLLWEVGRDGTGLHRLLAGWHSPSAECCGRWTPDGKYFLFQSNGQIWAMPKNAGVFRSGMKPIALTSSPMTLSSPLPSKDGKKIFLVGRTYRGELARYDLKTAQFQSFLGGLSAEYVGFSKDGQWVSYVSYPEGALWRSKVDGSNRLQLTYPPRFPVLPRWSPDGKTILFFEFALGPEQPARMYQVSADGGSPLVVLPDNRRQQLDPNWSPDGTKIIFGNESNDPSSAIHVLDLVSHELSDIPGSQGLYSPRWSPDGLHISAFSADSKTLLLFDIRTRKWAPLASGSLSWLNWSHDGKYVYMLDYSGKTAVVRIRVADGKAEQVADLQNMATVGRYGAALALAPDDSPLILRDTGSQDVYSVDFEVR